MPLINRLMFFTIPLSLILSLFCFLPPRTTFASRNLHCAHRSEGHSPAYKEGMNALRNNDYEKAAEHFNQAAADKPDDMWAFYYFGLCLLKLKRFDEAAKAYQQAMLIKPKEAAVHYQLGKIYLEMGDQEAANKEHQWLQEHDRELALYLSDLLTPHELATRKDQEAHVSSITPQRADNGAQAHEPTSKIQKPTITYKVKPKYTEIARINALQGTVVLSVVFAVNSEIQGIRVISGLPDGLTRKAIEAVQQIKFKPAIKNGEPIRVRGSIEYSFNLY